MCINWELLTSYKVYLCFYCCVKINAVRYGYFCGDKTFMNFVTFLIHDNLYTWCVRYNTCSAWFLDIRYKQLPHS